MGLPLTDFVDEKAAQEYLCPICLEVAETVVTGECGHMLCEVCERAWRKACPTCKAVTEWRRNAAIQRQIDNLPRSATGQRKGCCCLCKRQQTDLLLHWKSHFTEICVPGCTEDAHSEHVCIPPLVAMSDAKLTHWTSWSKLDILAVMRGEAFRQKEESEHFHLDWRVAGGSVSVEITPKRADACFCVQLTAGSFRGLVVFLSSQRRMNMLAAYDKPEMDIVLRYALLL